MLPRPSFDDAGESWPREQEKRRPRRWLLWLPFALLLVLAAAWSGAWFYAASLAEKKIEEWRAREAQRGRVYACGSGGLRVNHCVQTRFVAIFL